MKHILLLYFLIVQEKPTAEEYAIAKDLRFSLPVKEGRLHGMDVKYFIGKFVFF